MTTIEDIRGLTIDMVANIYGDDLAITYRPMAIMCDEEPVSGDVAGLVRLVVKLVAEWDLYEADRITKVPITFERLNGEPMQLFSLLVQQITNHSYRRTQRSAERSLDDHLTTEEYTGDPHAGVRYLDGERWEWQPGMASWTNGKGEAITNQQMTERIEA